ncbi:MAG: helix-turn-helix domain-containing protein [Bryobacterales bacterium]|nr:helix-turn-helix domain-containing protein [Bryobacteraceae bacterium]MDW8129681.1 helix-turn-helix domain-containing protein [Bryobacterales bacterium]
MLDLNPPGSELLAGAERVRFRAHFQQDLEFFRVLMVLFNKANPIRNLDLIWSERDPSGASRMRSFGTTEAMDAPCSQLLGTPGKNPHPEFCNLINDWGRRKAESCGVSDAAAAEVVKRTGRPYVYECRFGLTDIAVPVVADGRHIATLFTGQVLREPPTEQSFARVARAASALGYVDLERLAEAYRKLPVVSEEDIRTTTQIVEAFAQWLARCWSRIREIVSEERRKHRERALARKELAYLALQGLPPNRTEVRRLMSRLGIERTPNRVLLIRMEPPESGPPEEELLHEVQSTSALQAVEDVCETHGDLSFADLPSGEICVFFHDPGQQSGGAGAGYARSLAYRLRHSIRERCQARIRIGVGNRHEGWQGLRESYREACSALMHSEEDFVTYHPAEPSLEEPYRIALELPQLLTNGSLAKARECASSVADAIARAEDSAEELAALRLFLASTLQSICFSARELGCPRRTVQTIQKDALEAFHRASNPPEMARAWVKWCGLLMDEIGLLESGRRRKIVARACRLVTERLESGCGAHRLCAKTVAAELGLSRSHFSRLFKQETGQTFAAYLTARRLELAQKLLLDPTYNVSQVSERCGYKDVSYLAKLFRRFLGCSPLQFCRDPAAVLARQKEAAVREAR